MFLLRSEEGESASSVGRGGSGVVDEDGSSEDELGDGELDEGVVVESEVGDTVAETELEDVVVVADAVSKDVDGAEDD